MVISGENHHKKIPLHLPLLMRELVSASPFLCVSLAKDISCRESAHIQLDGCYDDRIPIKDDVAHFSIIARWQNGL
jgi:hypothetical protein